MIYHLFEYLQEHHNFPGAGLFRYLSFRSGLSVITSLIISTVFGKRIIQWLQLKQVGEIVRDLGLEGQMQKQGTPTMGGLIILASILIPALLFADLTNVYIQTMILATVWFGAIGFIDDYIKVFKKNKQGLAGRFKVIGQIGGGILVGSLLYFSPDVKVQEKITDSSSPSIETVINQSETPAESANWVESRERVTTIPFIKNNEFNYQWIIGWMGEGAKSLTWLVFILVTILIVTAVSNGANMTDGLDGLATGASAVIGVTLAVLAYVSGNYIFADYLNIMYIPMSGELVVFISAFVGACIGFLWYNAYPAQVFMGDTGSLALGGIIAVFAIAIRKEFLIPLLCGIFLIENLSVMIQVSYFKYTKKKYGEGRRVFLMAPLHHHYQKKNIPEPKIVARFWIIGILLAVFTIVTLKIR
ncbi:MAG: phospho-N-acetylmuramoyl-pentapeptide-transferase [Flavobacteriales bacterium]|nr:phospho-N-acetylmuramoyl-pentapeptide-transferase [Flavobacteriales bacterium]